MIISIDPADPRPIYVQIMDEVRRGIVLGLLVADDSLPSVRQLAVELRINPNTVRQAYRELEREGVAYVQRGLGTFVAASALGRGERQRLARGVAERALHEAVRHGLSCEELVAALEAIDREREITS